nr:EamA family transporter [uncultured Cellulosilyticum sp.]
MIIFICYIVLTVSGLTLFKLGSPTNFFHLTVKQLELHFSLLSLLGIFCYGCSFILWLVIIKHESLSYIFPMTNGIITLMTLISGVVLLHESLQFPQIIGIICIITGVILINLFK